MKTTTYIFALSSIFFIVFCNYSYSEQKEETITSSQNSEKSLLADKQITIEKNKAVEAKGAVKALHKDLKNLSGVSITNDSSNSKSIKQVEPIEDKVKNKNSTASLSSSKEDILTSNVGERHGPQNSTQNNDDIELRVVKATEWTSYATIAIAILTIILAGETVRLRIIQSNQIKQLSEEAIKPKIALFIDTNPNVINLLDIHLVNNGNGTANNVKFEFIPDDNTDTAHISNKIIERIHSINFYKIGLQYLGAGQNKRSFLLSVLQKEYEDKNAFFNSTIYAKITCEDDLGKEYLYSHVISMSEFKGLRSIGSDHMKDISKSLKAFSSSFESIVSFHAGGKRIQADVYDNACRDEEMKEVEAMFKQKE